MIYYVNNINSTYDVIEAIKELFTASVDKRYKIEIKELKKRRSLPQNKLYWLYLTCIEQETGQDKNDLHDYFKKKWIKPEVKEVFGEQIVKDRTTTKLDTSLFKQYVDKIIVFANTELNITLPDPNDRNFEHFLIHYSKFL